MIGVQCLLVRPVGEGRVELMAWLPPPLAVKGTTVIRTEHGEKTSTWTVEEVYNSYDFAPPDPKKQSGFVPAPCKCIAPGAFKRG